jgi:peptidoglycan/LPS O-acetylase OafA/YrhL
MAEVLKGRCFRCQMNRNAATTVVAIALLGYGLYIGSYVPPLFVGNPPMSILVGFLIQMAAALAGAAGVWWRQSWAAFAIVVLGAAIAATALVEGFVLGLVGYNHALGVAILGLVITIALAVYVSRSRFSPRLHVVR